MLLFLLLLFTLYASMAYSAINISKEAVGEKWDQVNRSSDPQVTTFACVCIPIVAAMSFHHLHLQLEQALETRQVSAKGLIQI